MDVEDCNSVCKDPAVPGWEAGFAGLAHAFQAAVCVSTLATRAELGERRRAAPPICNTSRELHLQSAPVSRLALKPHGGGRAPVTQEGLSGSKHVDPARHAGVASAARAAGAGGVGRRTPAARVPGRQEAPPPPRQAPGPRRSPPRHLSGRGSRAPAALGAALLRSPRPSQVRVDAGPPGGLRPAPIARAAPRARDLAAMPRLPTSSEDEMAQSFSDYSMGSESDSSKDETVYDTIRATGERPSGARMEETQGNTLVIRVVIQDLQQTKCIRFNPDATVWVAKQRILCTLNQGLKDVLNYGLFQPASNGRHGKFLDEERLLREYPQPAGPGVPSLEFRYKKRVYKQPDLDEKQLAKLHTKANLKKFMDHTQHRAVEKLAKLLDRGLDPNFHDLETGETPLTLAAQLDGSTEVIKALRNGGAHLDFRARDGMTALHKAARTRNQAALKTLLELGASPDYKDSYGLTPLYHTAIVGGDPYCCELLLHERASVCCRDENGWQEIHQACRYGHVQQLEHLLFYGADMGAQNASGNTALHICALYNQDSCARVLLFRGGNKELKNYNSQTPFQVAIIAGNFELAEYIKNHRETDVVPLVPTRRPVSGAPPYTHRPAVGWAQSCTVDEPAGLLPPAPGFHRTCSGEQSRWTGSASLALLARFQLLCTQYCSRPGEALGRSGVSRDWDFVSWLKSWTSDPLGPCRWSTFALQ
ncbi:hypothetical protein GHT09_020456 [Marmota monax]|uniref:Talin N-terminal F0 domain-containing protein n=1 Tax=Marmota monax TaxID=9995 RepID=A0A834PHC6_MARMO|nr:hypothetical protein GHT09_020456 [Marmota monax]